MKGIDSRAKFDFIRYSNCWEDADVLLDALDLKPNDKIISVASAGDNSLSLLSSNPELVVAADINPVQLACLDLRIAGFKSLDYEELLELLGVTESDRRLMLYARTRVHLADYSRSFFDARHELVSGGIIFSGKFERYFSIFRNNLLPLIHSRKTMRELVAKKPIEEQREFYSKKWSNLRYRLLFRVFFGRFVMGRLGRDPEFFNYVSGSVSDKILARSKFGLTEISTYTNPYLNFIILGNYTKDALPHYLRREYFEVIKANIGRILPFPGSIRDALASFKDVRFDAFNLSDIFEYAGQYEFERELIRIGESASRGARIAYWDLLAERLLPGGTGFEHEAGRSAELFKHNKAFFYDSLVVARKG